VTGVPDWYLTDYIGSVRAIVRDAGGYGNGLEVLDEITYDSFGNVLSETNLAVATPSALFAQPSACSGNVLSKTYLAAGDRFRFTACELDAALSLYY
jgi:hypothetical protein